ncbi:MAG TPA: beta-galactosidase [Candidatus Blautia faecipullorum]|nr:beta-galactosidase [Candidatus Blautia faecipullorum]
MIDHRSVELLTRSYRTAHLKEHDRVRAVRHRLITPQPHHSRTLQRYGTIDELNRVWDTAFWGHTLYDWDDVVLPNLLSEHFEYDRTQFQGITLDYKRFNSESILQCYRMEYDAVKSVTPDIPVTTNLMGSYKGLDYQMWANYMDVVSWDNYPANEDSPASIAMDHDLMRGIKGGAPFLLMEQTPSVTNWLPYNALSAIRGKHARSSHSNILPHTHWKCAMR